MRLLLTLFVFIVTPVFSSTLVTTQIHEIDMGNLIEEPMIYLKNGQVVTYPLRNKSDFDLLHDAITSKKWFSFKLNDQREIVEMHEVKAPLESSAGRTKMFQENAPFVPSILKDLDQAKSFFAAARAEAKEESQCYNRAHIWAYEWRTKANLYSSKAWIFFTRRFIRKHKFEWWFHVAPMVHVVADGEVKERVMDIKYSKGPLKLRQWTDIFMRGERVDCPVVQKYSDHSNAPEAGMCFSMKSSMYYYQPVDLEQEEINGVPKTRWLFPEVKHAYLDAFDVTI